MFLPITSSKGKPKVLTLDILDLRISPFGLITAKTSWQSEKKLIASVSVGRAEESQLSCWLAALSLTKSNEGATVGRTGFFNWFWRPYSLSINCK